MAKKKIKTKRQLDAHRAADSAVLAHRARKAQSAESVIERPTPEQIEQFAVGGCGGQCNSRPFPDNVPCRPTSVNDCYHEVAQKYGCPMKVTSGGQLGVDGTERIAFTVEPQQSTYFLPIFVRLTGRARDDPDQLLVWRLTAVSVNGHPQENYNQPTPTLATLVGVESVAYDGKTAGDQPGWEVAWGPFSRSSMASELTLIGFNPYPAGTFMIARAELWGYEIRALPAGWECGHHPGCRPKPNGNGGNGHGGNGEPPPPVGSQPTGSFIAQPHTRPM
ncbi:MAG: hypothetical protein K0V04_02385 [Deltaproteobacteria bacterium]|nr:hypothetical protein [Deltaproteobacteria bacterium]